MLPEFGATRETVYLVAGSGLAAGQVFYGRIQADAAGADRVYFALSTLKAALARGTRHALMVALACGALAALALATAAMWLVLSDELFILYAGDDRPAGALSRLFLGTGLSLAAARRRQRAGALRLECPGCTQRRDGESFRPGDRRAPPYLAPGLRAFGWLAPGSRCLRWPMSVSWSVSDSSWSASAISCSSAPASSCWWWLSLPGAAAIARPAGSSSPGCCSRRLRSSPRRGSFSRAPRLTRRSSTMACRDRWSPPPSSPPSASPTDCASSAMRSLRRSAARKRTHLPASSIAAHCWSSSKPRVVPSRSNGLPIAVLFLDLDFFKSINDSFGHAAGDACLAAVIPPIQAELRQSDIIGRYGGEEFIVVLTGADAMAAEPIAERIRQRVSETLIEGHGEDDSADVQYRSGEQRAPRRLGRSADSAGRHGRLCGQTARSQPRTGGDRSRGVARRCNIVVGFSLARAETRRASRRQRGERVLLPSRSCVDRRRRLKNGVRFTV